MCTLLSAAPVFSLSLWERAGVRASVRTFPPHPNPLPQGRGDRLCMLLSVAPVFSLSLWERAGVRASVRTFPPRSNPLPQGRGDRLCTLLSAAPVFSLSLWERGPIVHIAKCCAGFLPLPVGEGRGEGIGAHISPILHFPTIRGITTPSSGCLDVHTFRRS